MVVDSATTALGRVAVTAAAAAGAVVVSVTVTPPAYRRLCKIA